jgi:predicted RNA-binding Zn-ribbon protein involved in translation (DUF1610 family)
MNPPPESEACLFRLRSSTQKGGTLIAEEVTDHATHERRICDPDGYRSFSCPRCGERRLHVHDYRERVLRAEPGKPVTRIVRLLCVSCDAIWQILPLFIARHLWRTWNVVRHALMPEHKVSSSPSEPQHLPKVPPRTVRRWRARWLRPALALVQILAASGKGTWAALATRLPSNATCADLVAAYAREHIDQPPLAALAALLYRLQPKVRLM